MADFSEGLSGSLASMSMVMPGRLRSSVSEVFCLMAIWSRASMAALTSAVALTEMVSRKATPSASAWCFSRKCSMLLLVEQTNIEARRTEPGIGVVLPQQQAVLGPRGEEPVGLLGAAGDQIIDEDPDVGLGPVEDERFLAPDIAARH